MARPIKKRIFNVLFRITQRQVLLNQRIPTNIVKIIRQKLITLQQSQRIPLFVITSIEYFGTVVKQKLVSFVQGQKTPNFILTVTQSFGSNIVQKLVAMNQTQIFSKLRRLKTRWFYIQLMKTKLSITKTVRKI